MKKIILGIVLIAGITSLATAQNVRLNGYAAYVFEDNVDSYYDPSTYYNGQIDGGFQWGAGLEYMVAPTKGVELKYLRRDATAPMTYYNNGEKFKVFNCYSNFDLL